MSSKGMKGAVFVPTSYVGQAGQLTWTEILTLQNTHGWEIGNHTVNHAELPLLTANQIRTEINQAKTVLTNKGAKVTSFASPFGAHNNRVLIEMAKTHNLHRGFWERGYLNTYPYERTVVAVQSVDSGTTVAQVKDWIDQAKAEKKWLVLVFHDIQPELNPDYFYTTTISDFTQIVEYVKDSGIDVVLPNHSLQKPGPNLFTTPSFTKGLSEGWSTDNSTQISFNTGNNGSYPSSRESVLIKGSNKNSHLFSNLITHTTSSKYSFEVFVNANALTAGEVGFYMDEYNSSGEWISGQWLGAMYPGTVAHYSTPYTPTSTSVKTFSLQTYIDAGSKGRVFVDNYELYNMTGTNPPTTPPPASENLVLNGSFEELVSGWANNWRKDNDKFVIDTSSKGNSGTNSLHLTSTLTSAHTFSDIIPVQYGKQYIWKQYIKMQYVGGEFGFYIDEYNSNGDWISGQWKGMVGSSFTGEKEIQYTPTSSNVKTVGLQYYVTPGSNINLYLDSVKFISM